jgi:hypothetical protein
MLGPWLAVSGHLGHNSAAGNKFEVTKPLFAAAAPDQRWYRIETSERATIDQLRDACGPQ